MDPFTLLTVGPALIRTVGEMFGGKTSEVAGKVADVVDSVRGLPKETAQAKIGQVIAEMPAEDLIELKKIGVQLAEIERDREANRLRFESGQTRTFVQDTQHARDSHKGDAGVFRLGIVILLTFALTMGAAMYGAYELLVGGLQIKDVGAVAAVFGFLGTVVGYVASNAQQVVSFFYGSSAGSKQKTDAMADALTNVGKS